MARTLHTDEFHLCDYKLNPGDCVWYNDGEFMIADELGRLSTMRVQKFVLDLSPLQKFMGRRASRCDCPTNSDEPLEVFAPPNKVMPKMYGMDYDFDWVPPAPSPEKSPQEKALEDFIAKRKAKREGSAPGYGWDVNSAGAPDPSYHKDMYHLDRAMRRLGFHEQDIHTRLMPYRREEKCA